MTFDSAFQVLIGHEGKYTDDRRDPGNWTGGKVNQGVLKGTKYGIAANTYGDLDIINLTLDDAKFIYKRDFWDKMRLNELAACGYDDLAFNLFDAAVNSGVSRSVKFVQKAVRAEEDGQLGPLTLRAILATDRQGVAARFNGARLLFFADLGTWPTYSKGWARRVAKNLLDTDVTKG